MRHREGKQHAHRLTAVSGEARLMHGSPVPELLLCLLLCYLSGRPKSG